MNQTLQRQVRELKEELRKEGFIIEAVTGSHARNEATPRSDIDLLYRLDPKFLEQNGGFAAFSRLESIRRRIAERLRMDVDLIASNNLSQSAKRYMLRDRVNV
jgi:predicted nucleotidyltransferase